MIEEEGAANAEVIAVSLRLLARLYPNEAEFTRCDAACGGRADRGGGLTLL
jgi:hypothetical protein